MTAATVDLVDAKDESVKAELRLDIAQAVSEVLMAIERQNETIERLNAAIERPSTAIERQDAAFNRRIAIGACSVMAWYLASSVLVIALFG